MIVGNAIEVPHWLGNELIMHMSIQVNRRDFLGEIKNKVTKVYVKSSTNNKGGERIGWEIPEIKGKEKGDLEIET